MASFCQFECDITPMIHVEADKSSQVLKLTYSGYVSGEELGDHFGKIKSLIEAMDPGFRFLTDLGKLESMDPSCAPSVAEIMDAANKKGVSEVVRVVPDAQKDIGFMVISRFHYDYAVRITTYENLEDALRSLAP